MTTLHSRELADGKRLVLLAAFAVGIACAASGHPTAADPPAETTQAQPVRVLMLTATAGFRHDSITAAHQTMSALDRATADISVTATEDLATITSTSLANLDVLFFALTTGELAFTADQKSAIESFVAGGKGFMGVHSAADTLYDWATYGRLVGAYFKEHPWTQPATVVIEDPSHPTMRGLADRFSIREEFYTFRENPRPQVRVLLRLDAASVGASGDYPLAWAHTYGQGRAYYNALGHFTETWMDARFQQQLLAAIRWVANRL
jgi:type 1 glutamine amidotransferase